MFGVNANLFVVGPFSPVIPTLWYLSQCRRAHATPAHHAIMVGAGFVAFALAQSESVKEASGNFTRNVVFR